MTTNSASIALCLLAMNCLSPMRLTARAQADPPSIEAPQGIHEFTAAELPPESKESNNKQIGHEAVANLRFNFVEQPWGNVLSWLAKECGCSIDWQKLPKGNLNLVTERAYSIDEARDLLNRHLQARGYTLLMNNGVLSLFSIGDIDPSLVPMVSEIDLYSLQPHDFVKVVFSLPEQISAARSAKEIEQLLSKHATVVPMPLSNRIFSIDIVANLRLVSRLFADERMAKAARPLPRRFQLKYARAERVVYLIRGVLGLGPERPPTQMELETRSQEINLLFRVKDERESVKEILSGGKPTIHMVCNSQENSILVNATPAVMRLVEETIAYLDIPSSQPADVRNSDATSARSAKTYRLKNMDPESLLKTLVEIGDLQPLTDLRADSQAKILFARATQADHRKIEALVADLDTGGCRFEVFQLRRYSAYAVAGSIQVLLGPNEYAAVSVGSEASSGNDEQARRQDGDYNDARSRRGTSQVPLMRHIPRLRVDADALNNRLLVRGTDAEIAQVREFLGKLGELPAPAGPLTPVPSSRTLERLDRAATEQLLSKLRKAWQGASTEATLIIDGQELLPHKRESPARRPHETDEPTSSDPQATQHQGQSKWRQFLTASHSKPREGTGVPQGIVTVTTSADGRIVVASSNPSLLQEVADLLESLAPEPPDFHIFSVKHQSASYIAFNLREYYEAAPRVHSGGLLVDANPERAGANDALIDQRSSQSARQLPRILYDLASNTVLVANANYKQLEDINRLITTWDVDSLADTVSHRKTTAVKIHYSTAGVIATALKEVYRDLLSSRDKEFATDENEAATPSWWGQQATKFEYEINGNRSDSPSVAVGFDGALSIGVDPAANVIIVSAEKELLSGVVEVVKYLDLQAKKNDVVNIAHVKPGTASLLQQLID